MDRDRTFVDLLHARTTYCEDAVRYVKPRRRRSSDPARWRYYLVHHAAGNTTWDAVVRYHMGRLGWDSPGYHVTVSPTGRVAVLAYPGEHIAYSAGSYWNPRSAAVCCLGNFDVAQPPLAMLRALYAVLYTLDDVYGDKPWRGHREARPGHTACPGRHLMPHVETMRRLGAVKPRIRVYP